MKKLLFILFPLFIQAQTIYLDNSDIIAFPGTAMGFGKNVTGGRGYGVYFVTNTSNSGAGSLRQALLDAESAGGGNIIFRTGGTVTITTSLYTDGDNISIFGQSAPGGGYQVYGEVSVFRGQNIQVRHIKYTPGDAADAGSDDCVRILEVAGTQDVDGYIFDHCSFRWGRDENFAVETGKDGNQTLTNLTVQNSIFAENFSDKNVILYGQGITNVSFIRNLFSNSLERAVRSSVAGTVQWEQVNNVIYHFRAGAYPTVRNKVDLVGNTFLSGPFTRSGSQSDFRLTNCSVDNCPPSGDTSATGSEFYFSDNTYDGGAITITAESPHNVATYTVGARNIQSSYVPISRAAAIDSVIATAGARANLADGRDAIDQRQIDDLEDGTTGDFISTNTEGGGLPSPAAGTPYTDTDGDGLSDAYETANGGSVTQSTRPATAVISNGTTINQERDVTNYATTGYTHLEIFMADLAGDWEHFEALVGDGITLRQKSRVNIGSATGKVIIGE